MVVLHMVFRFCVLCLFSFFLFSSSSSSLLCWIFWRKKNLAAFGGHFIYSILFHVAIALLAYMYQAVNQLIRRLHTSCTWFRTTGILVGFSSFSRRRISIISQISLPLSVLSVYIWIRASTTSSPSSFFWHITCANSIFFYNRSNDEKKNRKKNNTKKFDILSTHATI